MKKKKQRKSYLDTDFPFRFMKAGDSFIYSGYSEDNMRKALAACALYNKLNKPSEKLAVRKTENKIRIWKEIGRITVREAYKMKYKIEKRIPIAKKGSSAAMAKYPFVFMEEGDSFIYGSYSPKKMKALEIAFRLFAARINKDWRCAVRKDKDKIRLWKTKGERADHGINATPYKIEKNIPLIDTEQKKQITSHHQYPGQMVIGDKIAWMRTPYIKNTEDALLRLEKWSKQHQKGKWKFLVHEDEYKLIIERIL